MILKKLPSIAKTSITQAFWISRNSLYYKPRKVITDILLENKIRVLHALDPYYGQRRIAYALKRNKKPVMRIMQKREIYAYTRKRKFRKPWDKNLPHMWVENKKKMVEITTSHQVWSSDFTHLYYQEKELYLATVLDEYSKEIVWYTLGFHHGKELVIEALTSAVQRSRSIPEILHSDQGSEYRSYEYFDALKRYDISVSMSRKSSPWENGHQESFYWKFKFELWNLNRFNTLEEAIEAIHAQIYYYNNHRIHTALKMSPKEYKKREDFLSKFL